jgi:hypothetical protein
LADTCETAGGDWLAAGADCDLCPGLGGCCLEEGFCSLETSVVCADQGWTFLGEGSTCGACSAPPECPGESIFSQPPDGPSSFKAGTSEGDADFQRFEDFSGVAQPIEALTWWGLDLAFLGGNDFGECVESNPVFRILFYEDNVGVPGTQVCSYLLTSTYTPFAPLEYFGATLNEYGAILPTPCTLSDGWVSIVGFGDPDCWFLWMSAGLDGTSYCDNCAPQIDLIDLSVCFNHASLTLAISREQLTWNTQVGADSYDVVLGDIETLHDTDGNFTLATTGCIANDHPTPFLDYPDEPDPGTGFWILVRPVGPSTNGSYDSEGSNQVAPRDDGIAASPVTCP